MKAITVINSIIAKYNLSFSTRWRVLEQLFLVNGNGCYWTSDGCLDGNPEHYQESELGENKTIQSMNEMLELVKNYDVPQMTDAYHLQIRFEQGLDKFKQANMKKIAANQFFFFDSQRPTFKDLSRAVFNHLFYEVPDNVQPDWKALIVETACVAQKGIKESYFISGDVTDPDSWSNPQAFSFYMAAENQLKSLK